MYNIKGEKIKLIQEFKTYKNNSIEKGAIQEESKLKGRKINIQKKQKNIINKRIKSIIFIKLLLLDLISIISSPNTYHFFILKFFDIKLKIKGPGTKYIFSSNLRNYPNKIIINGIEKNSFTYSQYLNQTDNLVELIWNSKIKDSYKMFYGCSDIYEMDFSNFDTSEITYMNCMFCDCTSLTSLNLSNFDTSKVTCVEYMFQGCTNLKYINLKHFSEITIGTSHYTNMFNNVPINVVVCLNSNSNNIKSQLNSKNCKTFDCSEDWLSKQQKLINGACYSSCSEHATFKYEYNGECFKTCPYGNYSDENNPSIIKCKCQLEKCLTCPPVALRLNLCTKCHSGFYPKENDTFNVGKYFDCYNESKGYYLDYTDSLFKKCYERCSECVIKGNDTNHNCLICNANYPTAIFQGTYFNCYPKCNNVFYLDNNGIFICLGNSICPNDYNKLIPKTGQCTDNCSKIYNYQYEFRKKCYNICPSNISYLSKDIPYFCEVNCTKQNPFELVEGQNCIDFCGINSMGDKSCILKYKDEDINYNFILHNIHKDIITSNFNKSISYKNKKTINIEEGKTTFTIAKNSILKNEINQKINLGNCENLLKSKYNLKNTDDLIILIIDTKSNNVTGNNKLVYEVYADLDGKNILTKLDLNICNDILSNNEITKCSNYTIESLLNDLCTSCYDSFYPIFNNPLDTNSFVKCYKSPQGYYLDNDDQFYKKCYLSCSTCDKKGNYTNHNCLLCNINYTYELNILNNINCYSNCTHYSYYNRYNQKNYCTYNASCPMNYSKLIPERSLCVEDCSEDTIYKYEFRNTCYKECPYNISKKSEEKNYKCEVQCPKEFPFEIIETQYCVGDCTIAERQKGLCKINYESKDEEDKEAEEKAVDNVKEELTKDFDTSNVDNGENVVIQQKDSTITISTTENQKNEKSINTSTIDLGECEDKIKKEYHIPKNKSLYILKIDVKQKGLKIPKIEYEIYYPLLGGALIKLNLTVCENSKIDLSIPVTLTNDIDKVNSSSEYYNDICYTTTSEDGTDISLADRKKEFVDNNLTVCEEDCDFVNYDYEKGKAICSCKVKTNSTTKIGDIVFDKNKLYNSFTDFKNIANINVLKCYKLIFTLKEYKSNYANLILLSVIFLFIITLFIFYCKENNDLFKILNLIVFFKLNPKLVKIFLDRQNKKKKVKKVKRRKKKKKVKISEKDENNDKIESSSNIKSRNPKFETSKEFMGIKIKRPIYLQYLDILSHNIINAKIENKHNPIKKKKKKKMTKKNNVFDLLGGKMKFKSNKNNNQNLINRVQTQNDDFPILIYTREDLKGELNNEQIYEMFLKINASTHEELNSFSYKKAIKLDKRTFCQYYLSLVFTKHLLFFSFLPTFDYNSRILKIFLFFFNFTVNFIINALFFNDDTMHKIYSDKGSFNFIYNIPQILYSAIISGFINYLIQSLAITSSNLIEFKHITKKENINKRAEETKRNIKIKLFLFFVICLILLVFFWFYLACFCAVYKNTQIHLIKDTLISLGTSLIYPFGIFIFPGIFRLAALNDKKQDREFMFKFSKAIQYFC